MTQQAVFIDAKTNDYVLVEGTFKIANQLLTEIYTRLITPLGTYLFDPTFGCMLGHWIGNRQVLTAIQINREVNKALQPTIQQNRAKQITSTVNTYNKRSGLLILTIDVIDSDNNQFSFTIPYSRNIT